MAQNFIQYMHPLIGARKMGHTYPGATVPLVSVRLSPASDQYALGSPVIKTAVLKLENGKTLTIEARNQSDKNVYVEKVTVNGQTDAIG